MKFYHVTKVVNEDYINLAGRRKRTTLVITKELRLGPIWIRWIHSEVIDIEGVLM